MERVLRKRMRRIVELGPNAMERADPKDLRDFRSAVERLRYDLEFVAPIAAQRSAEPIRLLALLHERLGAIADATAFARSAHDMRDSLAADDPRRAGLDALFAAATRDGDRALAETRRMWNGGGGAAETYPGRLAASISAALGSLSPNDDP